MNSANGTGTGLPLFLSPELVEHFISEIVGRVLAEMPTPDAEPYLSVDDAAVYLACEPKRIYELKEAGKLRHRRDGRRLLFRRCDLDEWVEP
jgi:excisionase family DNA binding protein